MEVQLDQQMVKRFLDVRLSCSAVNLAIKEAKLLGFGEADIRKLTMDYAKYKLELVDIEKTILLSLYYVNMVRLTGNWYAVRFLNKKNQEVLSVEAILPDKADLWKREGRAQKELTYIEKSDLEKVSEDLAAKEEYKFCIRQEKSLILQEFFNVCSSFSVNDQTFYVTNHAFLRWKQRVQGETKAFDKGNIVEKKQIYDELMKAFQVARKVYDVGETDFYLEKSKMVFFVVCKNIIITLYINDFNFNKEINTMITLNQLEFVQSLRSITEKGQKKKHKELEGIKLKIDSLEKNIQSLKSKHSELMIRKTALEEEVLQETEKLRREERKLFVEWERVLKENEEEDILGQDSKEIAC